MLRFRDKTLHEDCLLNADETHLSVNLDNGHTLEVKGDTEDKYMQYRKWGHGHDYDSNVEWEIKAAL